MGNTLRNNTQHGISIVSQNQPGAPIPLDLQIFDNMLVNNQDGIFIRGTANAQFSGQLEDNIFMMQNRDGIHVVLENDAALGNPNDTSGHPLNPNGALATQPVPAGTPFFMDGNQISSSGRNGVFFDTNFTNEAGMISGGAFANVLFRGSADNPRGLITGSGQHGVQIIDNSDFTGGLAASQNTYAVITSDILNSGVDGISFTTGTGVDFDAGHHLVVGDPDAPLPIGNRDVVISSSGDDGIDLSFNDADFDFSGSYNRLTTNRTTIINNGFSGDGYRATLGAVGHGLEVDLIGPGFDGGAMIGVLEDTEILLNAGDGMDFNVTTDRLTNLTVLTLTMHGVKSNMNGERGLDAFLAHDPSETRVLRPATISNFNIGTGDRATNEADVNEFNQNGREGLVFDMRADNLDDRTIRMPVAMSGLQVDINKDIFVETNLPYLGPPPRYAPSTEHPIVGVSEVLTPLNIAFNDLEETSIHFVTNVNFINSEAADNGGVGGFEDGLDFGVSAMTRLNSTIANSSFGGNVGDDIRVFAQQPRDDAGVDLNPPDSVNDNPAAIAGTLMLPQNYLVYDPVAYADIVFGSVDTSITTTNPTGDGVADLNLGNGRAAFAGYTTHTGRGDQIDIIPDLAGFDVISQITGASDVYDNNDPAKGGPIGTRTTQIAGQVQTITGTLNFPLNDFFQAGAQQNISNEYNTFLQNALTPWPQNNPIWFSSVFIPPPLSATESATGAEATGMLREATGSHTVGANLSGSLPTGRSQFEHLFDPDSPPVAPSLFALLASRSRHLRLFDDFVDEDEQLV